MGSVGDARRGINPKLPIRVRDVTLEPPPIDAPQGIPGLRLNV